MTKPSMAVIAAVLLLSGCGGGGGGGSPTPTPVPTPTPAPVPTPTPTPTPTPAVSFFEGVTHFDDFNRADTAPGTLGTGPQGQVHEVFADFLLKPDTITRIRNKRLYTPPVADNSRRASYIVDTAAAPVKRFGAVFEYRANTETTTGPLGYVWALMLSNQRHRFSDDFIHITGDHRSFRVEIWTPGPTGSRRLLGQGMFGRPMGHGQKGVVDVKLDGATLTITVPGSAPQTFTDPELTRYAGARYPIVEHYIGGNTQNINEFLAWYYEVDGAPALGRAIFAPFEPGT